MHPIIYPTNTFTPRRLITSTTMSSPPSIMSRIILPMKMIAATTVLGLVASAFWMVNFYGWKRWPTWSKCTILLITLGISGYASKALNLDTAHSSVPYLEKNRLTQIASGLHRPMFHRGRDLCRYWTWGSLGSFFTRKETSKDGP